MKLTPLSEAKTWEQAVKIVKDDICRVIELTREKEEKK